MTTKMKPGKVLFNYEQIDRAINIMAVYINRHYAGKKVAVVTLMEGGMVFAGHLLPKLNFEVVQTLAVKAKSYDGIGSGEIRVSGIPAFFPFTNLLVLDDIWDTGQTFFAVRNQLIERGAHVVTLVTLLKKSPLMRKKGKNSWGFPPKFHGLHCPDKFVVGFGLDYNGKYRNLPDIYELVESKDSEATQ